MKLPAAVPESPALTALHLFHLLGPLHVSGGGKHGPDTFSVRYFRRLATNPHEKCRLDNRSSVARPQRRLRAKVPAASRQKSAGLVDPFPFLLMDCLVQGIQVGPGTGVDDVHTGGFTRIVLFAEAHVHEDLAERVFTP